MSEIKVTLFITHYENKLMVAARRWRSLVSSLRKKGMHFYIVTPGLEEKEYIGEFGESVYVFKARSVFHKGKSTSSMGEIRRVIPNPFPYLDVSIFLWFRAINNKTIFNYSVKSDLLISTYGPAGSVLFGHMMARATKKLWVVDVRDSFQTGHSANLKILLKFNRWIEKKILGRASLSITIGQELAQYLTEKYQLKFYYIYNGWSNADHLGFNQRLTDDTSYFLYAGSVHQHQFPAFKIFLDSLSAFPGYRLRIRLIRDYSGKISQWSRENGFDDVLDICPPVSFNQLKDEMLRSVGMLVVESLAPLDWQKGTVTGKLFPLLVSGLPGMVISHQDVEVFKLAEKANGWFSTNNFEGSRNAIRSIIEFDNTKIIDNKTILSEYHNSRQAEKFADLCLMVMKYKNANEMSFSED